MNINIIEEIYKDIIGYEGLYKVSNYGNVMNMKSGRILNIMLTKGGRPCRITIYKDTIGIRF